MTSRPTPPGGWPIEQAITALNTDTIALRKRVLQYYQAETSGAESAEVERIDIARFELWPALIEKIRTGLVTARGRRTGAIGFEPIDPEMFECSEPNFKEGSFQQADLIFHAVRFFQANAKTRGQRRGTKPETRDRIVKEMLADLRSGDVMVTDLRGPAKQWVADRYAVHRETVAAASEIALSEFQTPANSGN